MKRHSPPKKLPYPEGLRGCLDPRTLLQLHLAQKQETPIHTSEPYFKASWSPSSNYRKRVSQVRGTHTITTLSSTQTPFDYCTSFQIRWTTTSSSNSFRRYSTEGATRQNNRVVLCPGSSRASQVYHLYWTRLRDHHQSRNRSSSIAEIRRTESDVDRSILHQSKR